MHNSTDRQFLSTVDVCVFRIKLLILGKPPVSHRSWDNSQHSVVARLQPGQVRNHGLICGRGKMLLFPPTPTSPQVPKLAMGPTHPVDCIMWVKWPGHEVDHSSPSVAKVKNEWSCMSICHRPTCSAQRQHYIDLFVFQTSVLTNLDSVPFWYLNIIFILCGIFY